MSKILIIEDEAAIRRVLKKIISEEDRRQENRRQKARASKTSSEKNRFSIFCYAAFRG